MKKIITLLFIVCFNSLFAGTTGKIAGKITDENNKTIPFANVQITELQLGVQSDKNGNFILRNISPGVYEVTCSQISFQTHKIKGVKIVSDETTILNIKLKISAEEIDGIQISEARTKMVDRLKTSSGNTISETTIKNVAVSDIEGLIAIQAGAIVNNGKLHIRGGKVNEVVYIVDGIWVSDAVDGEGALTVDVDAIKEMKVMTGGFPAEYGNAQSGVISIITKDGSERYSGKIEYNSDHLTNALNQNSDRCKLVLSGPVIPFLTKKLTFFLNAGAHWHDTEFKDEYGIDANDEIPNLDVFWQGREFYDPYQNRDETLGVVTKDKLFDFYNYNFKLKYDFSSTSKLTCAFRGKENDLQPYDHAWRYALEHYKISDSSQRQYQLSFGQVIDSNKMFSLKAGIYHKEFNEGPRGLDFDNYFILNDSGDIYLGCLAVGDCDAIEYLAEDGFTGIEGAQQHWQYYIPDLEGYKEIEGFYIPGSVYPENIKNENNVYTLRTDFDWQIDNHHNAKTGIEIISHDIDRYKYIYPWDLNSYRYNYYLDNYGTPRDSVQHIVTQEYMYYYDEVDIYNATIAASGETFSLKAESRQYNGYIQNKFELEGLVINAGLRLDTWYLGDTYRIMNYVNEFEEIKIPSENRLHFLISPRLGISHAVSEKDVLHFSYNHQSQLPQLEYVYANATWLKAISSQDNITNILLGNPELEPQTSITTEAGWQHQFNEDYVADLSIYYKKNFNYVSVQKRIDPNVNLLNYYQYISENYGSARGLDFNLQKMLSNYIVGSLSYSLGWAEGTDARVLDYKLQDTQTLREFPLDWDIRHSIGVNIAFEVQRDENFYIPFTDVSIPIDDYNINVLYNYASGAPYTDSGAADYETNSKRKPATDVMHLKITKNFNLSQKSRISVYCSINNLFDKKILNLHT
jgi:outer membrane receptor protein involved in Fe transport